MPLGSAALVSRARYSMSLARRRRWLTGPVNHRRLRVKLLEYRALLTKAALPKGVKP